VRTDRDISFSRFSKRFLRRRDARTLFQSGMLCHEFKTGLLEFRTDSSRKVTTARVALRISSEHKPLHRILRGTQARLMFARKALASETACRFCRTRTITVKICW
jgi:hypothetical protein